MSGRPHFTRPACRRSSSTSTASGCCVRISTICWPGSMATRPALRRCSFTTAYLTLAGTNEAWRGRGIQQARLQLAQRQGCDLVVGMTEPSGSSGRNLQRAGLGLVNTRTVWTRALE